MCNDRIEDLNIQVNTYFKLHFKKSKHLILLICLNLLYDCLDMIKKF